jgi:Predicted metalloendopeptidase
MKNGKKQQKSLQINQLQAVSKI